MDLPYSKSRLGAVQYIYSLNFESSFSEEGCKAFCASYDLDFEPVFKLCQGVLQNQAAIDETIKSALTDQNSFSRLDKVLLATMRAAVYEIVFHLAPKKVVISEYNKIAASFFDDKEAGLVTAVLNHLTEAP